MRSIIRGRVPIRQWWSVLRRRLAAVWESVWKPVETVEGVQGEKRSEQSEAVEPKEKRRRTRQVR